MFVKPQGPGIESRQGHLVVAVRSPGILRTPCLTVTMTATVARDSKAAGNWGPFFICSCHKGGLCRNRHAWQAGWRSQCSVPCTGNAAARYRPGDFRTEWFSLMVIPPSIGHQSPVRQSAGCTTCSFGIYVVQCVVIGFKDMMRRSWM